MAVAVTWRALVRGGEEDWRLRRPH